MLNGVVADPAAGKYDANEAGDGAALICGKINSRGCKRRGTDRELCDVDVML
jgi:hypothetical protein